MQSLPGGPAAIAGADNLTALPLPLANVWLALLLKPLLAWVMLKDEVQAVETALEPSREAGRERLNWLASRDTAALSQVQVRESAIASLAKTSNTRWRHQCSGLCGWVCQVRCFPFCQHHRCPVRLQGAAPWAKPGTGGQVGGASDRLVAGCDLRPALGRGGTLSRQNPVVQQWLASGGNGPEYPECQPLLGPSRMHQKSFQPAC